MAVSDAILTRLLALHPKIIDLSLDRMRRILQRLGEPQKAVSPVIHVAGTNGKGSTVAYLRAILEAAGLKVHAYTSPHLVRFDERILFDGRPIVEAELKEMLDICERVNDGASITFFEITTAAAYLAFARHAADYLLLEVGLGGRLDATNVIDAP
ncbi:MAG TPA: bifunctional folylpolyglutamate synthase/dihydrofolate synthase, partial [Pseudolabrys sp.]|nr:bifunctional folylpolyglutamate synthase/dihydrofolate synthase [Pseudolabrys sp.]